MPNEIAHRFPWEVEPEPATPSVEDTIAALQRDFAYAVQNTAIVVHSNNASFVMTANTQRGQIIPRGEVKFSDGTTVELQDIGMCQPGNIPFMSVQEIMLKIWTAASELGLEISK